MPLWPLTPFFGEGARLFQGSFADESGGRQSRGREGTISMRRCVAPRWRRDGGTIELAVRHTGRASLEAHSNHLSAVSDTPQEGLG